ncbi:MAG: hypothetical protein U0804_21605 [Gemmataceae bacterium]
MDGSDTAHQRAYQTPPADPVLAAVVAAWPTLPDPLRRAVLALIGAAGPAAGGKVSV